MLRNTRLLAAACIGLGMLLGYAAASGKLNPLQWAQGSSPAATAAADSPTCSTDGQACCCDGIEKGKMLALLDTHNETVARQAKQNGKKPNIVFIMGDDVGWFNIGAYTPAK